MRRSAIICLAASPVLALAINGVAGADSQPSTQSSSAVESLSRHELTPIAPPRAPNSRRLQPSDTRTGSRLSRGAIAPETVVGSLALVLGLFFLAAWIWRRASPASSGLLPSEVVQVLGRVPLAGRQQMHLVRCGNKLLLVSISTAGAETLTEISDPVEVDRLAGICQQSRPDSATSTFRGIFEQLGRAKSTVEVERIDGRLRVPSLG